MKRPVVVVCGSVGNVRLLSLIATVASLGSVLSGCGGSSANKADDGGLGNACLDYITKYCQRLEACEPGALAIYGFTSVADCTSYNLEWCNDELNAPQTGATPALVEQCGDGIAAQSCGDFVRNKAVSACLPRGGTVPIGGACSSEWQCASGRCSVQTLGVCGTCVAAIPAGQPCDENAILGSACADDLVCAVTTPGGTTAVCTASVAMGGACADLTVCPGNAYCDGTTNVCAQLPTIGQTCDPSTVYYCDPTKAGAVCDGASSLCVALSAVQAGQACSTIDNVFTGCNGACDPAGDAGVSTCAPSLLSGQACTSYDQCAVDTVCTAGVCSALVCDGAASPGNDAAVAPALTRAASLDRRRAIRPARMPVVPRQ